MHVRVVTPAGVTTRTGNDYRRAGCREQRSHHPARMPTRDAQEAASPDAIHERYDRILFPGRQALAKRRNSETAKQRDEVIDV